MVHEGRFVSGDNYLVQLELSASGVHSAARRTRTFTLLVCHREAHSAFPFSLRLLATSASTIINFAALPQEHWRHEHQVQGAWEIKKVLSPHPLDLPSDGDGDDEGDGDGDGDGGGGAFSQVQGSEAYEMTAGGEAGRHTYLLNPMYLVSFKPPHGSSHIRFRCTLSVDRSSPSSPSRGRKRKRRRRRRKLACPTRRADCCALQRLVPKGRGRGECEPLSSERGQAESRGADAVPQQALHHGHHR